MLHKPLKTFHCQKTVNTTCSQYWFKNKKKIFKVGNIGDAKQNFYKASQKHLSHYSTSFLHTLGNSKEWWCWDIPASARMRERSNSLAELLSSSSNSSRSLSTMLFASQWSPASPVSGGCWTAVIFAGPTTHLHDSTQQVINTDNTAL